MKCLFFYKLTTVSGAKTAAVIDGLLGKGVKYSHELELSAVNNFPNTPFLLIEITVLNI